MVLRFLLLGFILYGTILAQSIDEEEAVSVGGGQGFGSGNGNGHEDDEDLAGSGLPPDHEYATTPSFAQPRVTTRLPDRSTEAPRKSASTIITQRPRVEQPVGVSTTTSKRPLDNSDAIENNVETSAWSNSLILVLLVSLIAALLLLIVAVLVCKGCNNKKRTYRTESKEPSANGLLQKVDY